MRLWWWSTRGVRTLLAHKRKARTVLSGAVGESLTCCPGSVLCTKRRALDKVSSGEDNNTLQKCSKWYEPNKSIHTLQFGIILPY